MRRDVDIAIARSGGSSVISVTGDIDLQTAPRLRAAILTVLEAADQERIVLDLRGVDHVDSSGIATLVDSLKQAKQRNTRLILSGLNQSPRRMLDLTCLASLFEIAPAVEDAIHSQHPRYVVFTDLHGMLPHHDPTIQRAIEPALDALRAHEVPLIFCTSETRAEVERVRMFLGNQDPFIVENGAAVLIPHEYFPFSVPATRNVGAYGLIELGLPYSNVVAALRRASEVSGCEVRSFYDMSAEQIAARYGMSIRAATRAKQREYDEPFEILSESPAVIFALFEQLEAEGLTWTRGRHFYHVRGRHNKGQAVKVLMQLFRLRNTGTVSVGLGDGPNDLSLLEVVDVPIAIPLPCGDEANATTAGLSDQFGSAFWNRAVLQLLEQAAPPVSVLDR